MINCPICLSEPLVTSTNSTRWYCYCKVSEHNRRLTKDIELEMSVQYSKDEAINFWNSVVQDYMKAHPELENELPLACTLCGVVPTAKQNEGVWSCFCADEEKHTENQDGMCACGHRDHAHGLFGVRNANKKSKAIREWNEYVIRYQRQHGPEQLHTAEK